MHGIYELKEEVIRELEEFGTRGEFSRNELPTIDMLAHTAKNLCKVIEMCENMTGYSYRSRYYGNDYSGRRRGYSMASTPDYYNPSYSMARNRDSMGRYASDNDWMIETLHDLKNKATNDQMRNEFDEFIMRMERMKK